MTAKYPYFLPFAINCRDIWRAEFLSHFQLGRFTNL